MTKTVAIVLLAMASALWAQTDAIKERDDKVIGHIKQISVAQLDSVLPAVSFEKWLRIEAGADAEFRWEVNDCGEQTGTAADRDRDFPLCVEVQANMKDHRTIVVSIAVGTFHKGAVGKPTVYFAQLTTPRKSINLDHLSDLPAAIIKTHEPARPEVAK